MNINRTLAAALLLCLSTFAQQPNSAEASLTFDGQDGPPYPIQPVPVTNGVPVTVAFGGTPSMPLWLSVSATLSPGALVSPQGIIDLDYPNVGYFINGDILLDAAGAFSFVAAPPPDVPHGLSVSYQGLVLAPQLPEGAVLSAATRVVTNAIHTTPLLLPDDGTQLVDLSAYGLSLSFYEQNYSGLYVNSNGSCTFILGDTDFTSSSQEFLEQEPRISAFWTDLSPTVTMEISWEIDYGQSPPLFSVISTDLQSFGAFTFHSFTASIQTNFGLSGGAAGDVTILHEATNIASPYDALVGISPGLSLSAATALDLDALAGTSGYVGGVNEALYEFFAGPFSTSGFPGTSYDLTGTVLNFIATDPGQPGARYTVN